MAKNRLNVLLAAVWVVFAIANAYFGYARHLMFDWLLAAGCIVVAGMYALRLVRK